MFGTQTSGSVLLAQAGWDNTDDMLFQGGFDDDGNTLVRCQLFEGRDITKEHTPDRAQGHRMVCQIADGVKMPKKGAIVYLLVPAGMEAVPGAGCIVAVITTGALRKNIKPGNQMIMPAEGEAMILQKTDGTVTIHTTTDNSPTGPSVFFRIGPKGLEFRSPYGSMVLDATGWHCITRSGARIDMGGVNLGPLPSEVADAFTNYCKITAATTKLNSGTVLLGTGAVHHPAMVGPVKTAPGSLPPTQVASFGDQQQSQTVYVSP